MECQGSTFRCPRSIRWNVSFDAHWAIDAEKFCVRWGIHRNTINKQVDVFLFYDTRSNHCRTLKLWILLFISSNKLHGQKRMCQQTPKPSDTPARIRAAAGTSASRTMCSPLAPRRRLPPHRCCRESPEGGWDVICFMIMVLVIIHFFVFGT